MIKPSEETFTNGIPSVSSPEEAVAMTATRKFLFNRSFDTDMPETVKKPDEENGENEETEPEEVVPGINEEELKAARDEAFAKGREEGINEAAAATERDILASLQKLNEQFTDLFKSQEAADTSILESAISVATGITRKVFPALNEQGALSEIERMVVLAMEKILEEPLVTITIHPDLEAQLKERIGALSTQAGYKGEIRILAAEDLPAGDCRVEWNSGGARRDTAGLWQEIDEIVERNLSGLMDSSGQTLKTEPETLAEPAPEGTETRAAETPPAPAASTEASADDNETPGETPGEDDTAPDQQGA